MAPAGWVFRFDQRTKKEKVLPIRGIVPALEVIISVCYTCQDVVYRLRFHWTRFTRAEQWGAYDAMTGLRRPQASALEKCMGGLAAALEKLSSLKGPFESYPVGIFEVAAHRYAVSDACYTHGVIFEDLEKVMSGSLSFAARVGGYDNFTDIFGLESGEKFFDSDLIGTDPVKRGQYALEHVITAFESAGLLDGQKVGCTFHYANFPDISGRIAANGANAARP